MQSGLWPQYIAQSRAWAQNRGRIIKFLPPHMTTYTMVKTTIASTVIIALGSSLWNASAWGQPLVVTPVQTATARQVAKAGVPLSELAPDAPDSHTVKRGDTLWSISTLFLRSPWRWPELWGMNMDAIKNPHLIYPGQKLVLEKSNGRAVLRTAGAQGEQPDMETVRLSPRTRVSGLSDAIQSLDTRFIEPFLAEPLIVEAGEMSKAPRIVATRANQVMLTRGDRAYVRGSSDAPVLDDQPRVKTFRIFRDATLLKDPESGEVLGYEAQFVGKATLAQGESTEDIVNADGKISSSIVPATIDITVAKQEMRVGDRLLPEPERQILSYLPHAPEGKVGGRIVSIYGSDIVANAAQNQIVVISRGQRDGIESGHVMAILQEGQRLIDKTDPTRAPMKLPDERNGLLMVFKTFEKLSYALILNVKDAVRVGDRLAAPR
jgi:LysM repeat protein